MAVYSLENTQISICVDSLGAELRSLKKKGDRHGVYVGCQPGVLEESLSSAVSDRGRPQ